MAFRYRCNTHVLRNYVQHLMIMRLVHESHILYLFLSLSLSFSLSLSLSLFDFVCRRFRSAVTSHPYDVKWKVRHFELENFKVACGFGSCTRFSVCCVTGHAGFPRYFIRPCSTSTMLFLICTNAIHSFGETPRFDMYVESSRGYVN